MEEPLPLSLGGPKPVPLLWWLDGEVLLGPLRDGHISVGPEVGGETRGVHVLSGAPRREL